MPEIKQKDENLNIKETNKAKNDEKNIRANDDKIMPNDNDQKENESKDDEAFDFDNLPTEGDDAPLFPFGYGLVPGRD